MESCKWPLSVQLFHSWTSYFLCCFCQAGMRSAAPGSPTRSMITVTCLRLCPWESGLTPVQIVWIRVEIWSASPSRLNRASSKVSFEHRHASYIWSFWMDFSRSFYAHFWHSLISAQIQTVPTGVSLWMGAHDSITEGGWMWTDGSPFRYINWAAGDALRWDDEAPLKLFFHLSNFKLNGEDNLHV